MARTINTIYSDIITAKNAEPALINLDSSSSTAVYKLIAYIVATAIFVVETAFDLFRSEIDGIIASKTPGTLLWYRSAFLAFQFGYPLIYFSGKLGYSELDDSAKIITQCSVKEAADGLVIKIAKDVNGNLQPLTLEEENAFIAYVSRIKFAGTHTRVINIPANKLMMSGYVYYDPLILNADGTSKLDGSRPVDDAVHSYLRQLPFDGRLKKSALMDIVCSTLGVFDFRLINLKSKYSTYSYIDILVSHVPEAGYFVIDTTYPLSTSFTYVPHV